MVRGKISVGGKSRANFWVGVCVGGIGSRIAFNRSRGRPFNQERKGLKGKEKEVETTFCEGSSRKDEILARSRNSEAVVVQSGPAFRIRGRLRPDQVPTYILRCYSHRVSAHRLQESTRIRNQERPGRQNECCSACDER